MSTLRAVLAEVRAATGEISLTEIGDRLGVGPDEVEAMLAYWVRRGRVSVQVLAGGTCALSGDRRPARCPSGARAPGCGGCPLRVVETGWSTPVSVGARGEVPRATRPIPG